MKILNLTFRSLLLTLLFATAFSSAQAQWPQSSTNYYTDAGAITPTNANQYKTWSYNTGNSKFVRLSFDAITGVSYTFKLTTSINTQPTNCIRLIDAPCCTGGTTLAINQGFPAQVVWTATYTGTVYVLLSDCSSASCGTLFGVINTESVRLDYSCTCCTAGSAPTSVSSTSGTSFCSGQSTTLSQVGGSLAPNAYWVWRTGSCDGTLVDTGATITVMPSTTTTYYVRGEGGTCNTACASITLTASALFNPVIYGPTSLCGGQSTSLSVVNNPCVGNCAYTWSNGMTGSAITVSPSVTTTYKVTVSNSCGDSASANYTLNVHPAVPSILQSGNVLTSSDSTQTAYQWYFYSGGTFNPISGATTFKHTAMNEGCYRVRISDNSGCMAYSDSVCVLFTGINPIAKSGSELSIYPNPVTERALIQSQTKIDFIELKNITGKLMLRKTVNSSVAELKTSQLPAGIYILSIHQGSKQTHRKIVVN